MVSKIYGVRHIGFFTPILHVAADGFTYKGRKYRWDDIVMIKRTDDILYAFILRHPSTTLVLSDATIIRIPTIVEEKGKSEWLKFQAFGYKNNAYDDLIKLIEAKINSNRVISSLEGNIVTRGYIYVYRFLFLGGLLLSSFLPIISWIDSEGLDRQTFRTFLGLSIVAISIGVSMFFLRLRMEKQIRKQLRKKPEADVP